MCPPPKVASDKQKSHFLLGAAARVAGCPSRCFYRAASLASSAMIVIASSLFENAKHALRRTLAPASALRKT
jgi:hypothetical protein